MKETALPRREQKTGAVFSPQEAEFAAALLARVPEPLLAWYDQNARVLPWRSDPTPYRVWISEIMLQQTRVEAARGYFERFVEALPDAFALAAVDGHRGAPTPIPTTPPPCPPPRCSRPSA